MKNKKGISLIVLIVTIIVIIILAAVVILTLSKNNPIESAKEATFKEDVRTYQDELNMYISNEYQRLAGQRDSKITATGYEKDGNKNSVYTYLSSFKKKYENKIAIKEDMIAYIGNDEKERAWLVNSGIYMSKQFTIRYINENGEDLLPSEEIAELNAEYTYYAKEIEGYLPIEEEKSGITSENTTITFEYCKICDDLAFIGLDANGNETEDEPSIVSYTVSGIGNCTDTWVAFPKKHNNKDITEIKSEAFRGNNTIKKLVLQDNVEKIRSCAFYGSQVEFLNVNAKRFVEIQAFQNSNLKEVYFGKNVENIVQRSFDGCRNLKKIKINTEIADFNGLIFQGSPISEIKVNKDNSKYKVIDNILYSKDETAIYYCAPIWKTEFTIPDNVIQINTAAFRANRTLTKIIINDNIKIVNQAAFSNCSNLEYVYLNAEEINGIETFRDSSISRIDIGKNVKKIGVPFRNCRNLTQINYLGTIEEWNRIDVNASWNSSSNITKVICTDGEINL